MDIVNTDSNLYCKYSEQEYFIKLNIEKDYFEYEQKSKNYWKDTLKANDTVLNSDHKGYVKKNTVDSL